MPKTYGDNDRIRAIALARVRGVAHASRELSIHADTLSRWLLDEPPSSDLENAERLALATLTADIADGKIRGSQLAVATGILMDKRARYGKRPVDEPDPDPDLTPKTSAASARLMAWLDTLGPEQRETGVRWVHVTIEDELVRRTSDSVTSPAPVDADAAGARAFDDLLAWMRDHLDEIPGLLAERDALHAARNRQRDMARGWLEDSEADLLIEAERALEAIA